MKNRSIIAAILCIALALSACTAAPGGSSSSASGSDAKDVVVFDDQVLEQRVRAIMNKPQGDITAQEAEAVTVLNLNNKDNKSEQSIRSIAALSYFKNLKELDIGLNNISDISPLKGLTKLEKYWSMNGNQDITDFTPLSGMTNMIDIIILSNKHINNTNINFLEKMTGLLSLWIQGASELSDISVVTNLTELGCLRFTKCNITDVTPIASLKKLHTLTLEGNPITDYSPLKDIYPNLQDKDFQL